MNILCVLTDSHKILFENYFIKTIPCPENVIVKTLDYEGDGVYESINWQKAVNTKIEFVISYLKKVENGTIFIFSDVDVQFFPEFSVELLKFEFIKSKKDVLFQKETSKTDSQTVNTGFYIAKSSPKLLKFFNIVLQALNNSELKNDQEYINLLLKDSLVNWGYLPFKYYAWSHGFPPQNTIFCHHANNAAKIKKKINQMNFVRAYVEGGYLKKKIILVLSNLNIKFKILKKYLK